MADLSLNDKIKKYYSLTGSVNRPESEDGIKLFEQIFNKDAVFNDKPLDVNALREYIRSIREIEIESCVNMYSAMAKSMGIEIEHACDNTDKCIEAESIQTKNFVTDNITEIGHFFINRKSFGINIHAEAIAYKDGSMLILNGSDISKQESDLNFIQNIRSKHRSQFQDGKAIDNIKCKTPSNAAVTVIGNSVNGWKEWKDKDENLLETYRKLINTHSNENIEQEIETDTDNESEYTGDDEMSPEEMIVKGLQGLLQGSRSMQIELGDETLKKLGYKIGEAIGTLNNPIENTEEYKWNTNTECDSTFEDSICGYNGIELVQALEMKKALLLMGVPGTGKTKILKYFLNDLTKGDKNRYKIITFGQETTYTDFIGGIVCINGQWKYVDGIFTTMCKLADEHPENKYYIGIDELSRGNAESIFGELMTGIEHRDTMLTLKNGRKLVIPHNLYIICTMNVTDNSTKKLDIAMLERFVQFRIAPQWNADYINKVCNTTDIKVNQLLILVSEAMFEINKLITNELNGRDKVIGTRSISDIQLTPENTKGIIRTQLLTEVEDRIKTYDNAKYQDYINIIKGACDEK